MNRMLCGFVAAIASYVRLGQSLHAVRFRSPSFRKTAAPRCSGVPRRVMAGCRLWCAPWRSADGDEAYPPDHVSAGAATMLPVAVLCNVRCVPR